jgi:transposase InsO family protein
MYQFGLSVGRYYDWVERQQRCTLDDHPPKPKVGFRALSPNEAWHVDASIIKLLDGTKAYIHAVIDNYSRRVLAWTVAETQSPMNTCYVLEHAAKSLSSSETKVYMDSGVENLNKDVDKLLEGRTIERVIAQVDVTFSNSMIESWWRSLKHGWLFINHLDNVGTLRKLIEFSVPFTIRRCRTVLSTGRHPTRCTSVEVRLFPSNLLRNAVTLGLVASTRIARWRAPTAQEAAWLLA